MSDQQPGLEEHRAVWSAKSPVDLAQLDDKRLGAYRHPDEWHALIVIAVAFALFLFGLAIAQPQVADLVGWLPSGLARTILEVLHPARTGPLVVLVLALMALVDFVGLTIRIFDLRQEAVEINATTFPLLAPVVDELRHRFDLPRTRIYASRSAPMAGAAIGIREPYVIFLSTTLLGTLTPDEFKFLLGRQMGRIELGHTRMALIFGSGQLPLSLAILQAIRKFLFGNYLRVQELSADRAGLLATRDLNPALSLLTKLEFGTVRGTKVDLVSLTPQAAELVHGRSAVFARIRQIASAHPHYIPRLLELTRWAGLPPEPPAATRPQTTPAAAAPEASLGPGPATIGAASPPANPSGPGPSS